MTASSYQQDGGRVIECDGDADGGRLETDADGFKLRTSRRLCIYLFILFIRKELDAFSVRNEIRVVIRKRNPERLSRNKQHSKAKQSTKRRPAL